LGPSSHWNVRFLASSYHGSLYGTLSSEAGAFRKLVITRVAVIKMLSQIPRGSGHAVALPAEPADAGLAVGRRVEELEVEGLHGLLLGLAILARGGGAGGQPRHDRLDAGQERHVGEGRVLHAGLPLEGESRENHVSTQQGAMAGSDSMRTFEFRTKF